MFKPTPTKPALSTRLLNVPLILDQAQIKAADKVADLGCGAAANFITPLSRAVGPEGIVYAVDIQQSVLANVEKKAKLEKLANVRIVWSDLEIFGAAKIETASLDAAFLINTLFQIKKRTEALRESARLLKRPGRLVIVDWEETATPLGPAPEYRVKKAALKAAAPKVGLILQSEFKPGEHHYGLVFEKA